MKKYLLLLFILPLFSFGQTINFDAPISETISIIELLDKISESKEDTYVVQNKRITYSEKDSLSRYFVHFYEGGGIAVKFNSTKTITFLNCQLPGRFYFFNSQITSLTFNRCFPDQHFHSHIGVNNCKIDELYIHQKSDTEKWAHVNVSKSKIGILGLALDNNDDVLIDSCNFYLPKDYDLTYSKYDFDHIIFHGNVSSVSVQNCHFNNEPKLNSAVSLDRTKCNQIALKNNDFETLKMYYAMAETKLIFKDNKSLKRIIAGPKPFFNASSILLFGDLKGRKIFMYDPDNFLNFYNGDSTRCITDPFMYNDLISFYSQLCTIYKLRGDQNSYNECYVELKGIETDRLAIQYQADKSLGSWFNWRLNQFLQLFCDFGTNPVKSLIISMYVILCFAAYYFFSYSEWDKINREFIMRQHLQLMTYLGSNKTLEAMYMENQEERLNMYGTYEKEIKESKKSAPWFMRFLGQRLFAFSIFKYNLIRWFYRRIDILKGTWNELKPRQKAFRGPLLFSGMLIYSSYLIGVKLINSAILSLNAFSTLGFGDIPVTGISRYVAIMEGFLGWFLLSIFSVTLISQIIQS